MAVAVEANAYRSGRVPTVGVDGPAASGGRDRHEVKEGAMTEYLPNVHTTFRATYPEVAGALDALGAASSAADPRHPD